MNTAISTCLPRGGVHTVHPHRGLVNTSTPDTSCVGNGLTDVWRGEEVAMDKLFKELEMNPEHMQREGERNIERGGERGKDR